jgi:hypothetical protein
LQDPDLLLRQRHAINLRLLKQNPVPLLVHPSTPSPTADADNRVQTGARQGTPEGYSDNHQRLWPLAAGVNKGNIDSSDGARRYYFWAGPGHIQVKLGFKEMGVLGAPLRQALSFDFLDESGRKLAHNAIVSETGLERLETSGDFASHQRLIIAVKPQAGLVQMGGYYEIEVTGAADFDKSVPDTASVVPRDTRPIQRSGVPLITHGESLTTGSQIQYPPRCAALSSRSPDGKMPACK